MLHSDDAEERAVESLIKCGLANKDDSRRIVKTVLCAALENRYNEIYVSEADIRVLDDSADSINHTIWQMEDNPAEGHRVELRNLVSQAQRILKVARAYLLDDTEARLDGMSE